MMTKSFVGVFGLITTFVLSGCAVVSQPVYKVSENNDCSEAGVKDNKCTKFDGAPYLLPRTKLKLTVPLITTTQTEGGFISSARSLFAKENECTWSESKVEVSQKKGGQCNSKKFQNGIKNSVCMNNLYLLADELGVKIEINNQLGKPQVSYKLGDVSISTEAEPDPDQLYYVEVKGGLFEKRSVEITYAGGGVLNEITASREDKTSEFLAKTFGSILGAVTKFGAPPQGLLNAKAKSQNDAEKACSTNIYRHLIVRAMSALEYLKKFPEMRNRELTGQANTAANTKDNLEFRLKELDASQSAAMAIFEGEVKEKTRNYEITVLPQPKHLEETIKLASFSDSCGLGRLEKQPNENITYTNVPDSKENCKNDTKLVAKISYPPQLANKKLISERVSSSLDSSADIRGIYYRVPETVRIAILLADMQELQAKEKKEMQAKEKKEMQVKVKKELLVKDAPLAQFGRVASLPAQTGSTNVIYKVTLDPVTGMLLKVTISSEAANTGIAKDFIDPVGDYLKARKDSNDELTKLQREEALLKTQKSIKELKEALGQ